MGSSDTASEQTRQLDYYESQNVITSSYAAAIKKNSSGTASIWWLRSASSGSTNSINSVNDIGNYSNNGASSTRGVSPAFRLG